MAIKQIAITLSNKKCSLTNGDTSMRASKVDIGLWDRSHPYLIICPTEESSKSAAEDNGPVPGGTTDGHTNQVLLSNEALNVTVWEDILELGGFG